MGGSSSGGSIAPLSEETYPHKLRLLEEAQHIPLERWKAPTVLAWLEVTLGMPQYGALCAENVRSGKVLLELSDHELESGLGIVHPMHRKKLRLAIEELREPRLCRYPTIATLSHNWVARDWLTDLGLPHYAESFAAQLVDGRVLDTLTKKELEKQLGVHRKFHQASIIHGIHLLRIVRFDRRVLQERRRAVELRDDDPVVWTNHRWVRWARAIDLGEYADNLTDSGVHGGLVVLESTFTADTMATALGIPSSKSIIRRHLATELETLVLPQRRQLEEAARCAKIERRRQEKLGSGGSLGRTFSRNGAPNQEKDKRRSSLRTQLPVPDTTGCPRHNCLPQTEELSTPDTRIVCFRHTHCLLQTQELSASDTRIVYSRHKNCLLQTQELCTPDTRIVYSRHKNCLLQTKELSAPDTRIVYSRQKNCLLQTQELSLQTKELPTPDTKIVCSRQNNCLLQTQLPCLSRL
ncbi:Sterile alpha motif domain [Trinorchestia longiramus]|nr:Sterile alpha motif domain [Trinorchestia longiramus]